MTWLLIAAGTNAADSAPAADAQAAIKPKKLTYAHIQIKGSLPEGAQPMGLFGETVDTLADILQRLRKAAEDAKVHGVVIHVDDVSVGWGKIHELRTEIAKIRAAGKPVYGYLESGETKGYLVAAACDQVVLPESGVLMLPGVRAEVTFYKNLFDWLQVEPQMLRVGEYKSAAEPYSRSEMSAQFREELTAVLDSFYDQILRQLAESRKLDVAKAKELVDQGVFTAPDAKAAGLIDHLAYEDHIEQLIKQADPTAEVKFTKGYGKRKLDTDFSGLNGMVKMMNLMMGVEEPERRSLADKIAVINAVGPITSGPSSADVFGEQSMGSATMIKAIRQARDDETVRAIVLRVDSPGGSALASDLMWHELESIKKPFIVSMGDTAASGGYYIAMGSDRIFAEPGTITGSIGVVGGKLALQKTFEKFGMTTSVVQRGANGGLNSIMAPFTDSEKAAMQKVLNTIYEQFTGKAAAGRKMDVAVLEKLARGRIYTGEQAKEIGLVDEIGTLADAIAYAKTAAGIDPEKKLERLDLPKPTSPFEQLLGTVDSETQARRMRDSLLQVIPTDLQTPLRGWHALQMLAREPAVVLMPFALQIR
ncbi:signal peptide peptidase SppA [bacterium]|nr:signal peptide peptidase SppA [bacterium]